MGFNNKVILITGGTGSFGRRCVQTILSRYRPTRLIIFSRDEFKQYEMQQEFNDSCMRYFLGDIRDLSRLKMAMEGVDYVIHAAALKQVPALEYNPGEALATNINGTQNVALAALEKGVSKSIMLSTDKAVSPINLYGASKLVAEKIFVATNNVRGPKESTFSIVRYGNVIGSRASVLPYFMKLAKEGATELPITDFRATRFWISLQQSVDFVLKSFAQMQGGETFIPKIPSIRIVDLAKAVAPQASLKQVGLRPGEKLHEVLCSVECSRQTIEFGDHYVIEPSFAFFQHRDYRINNGIPGEYVQEGFQYNSADNPHFLSVADLQKSLPGI